MQNIIEILVKLASDASLVNTAKFNKLLTDSKLNNSQVEAIIQRDVNALTKSSVGISKLSSFPIIAPINVNTEVTSEMKITLKSMINF